MSETKDPIAMLERSAAHGALWRILALADNHAEVELCTCHGEPVHRFEAESPALIAYLRRSTTTRES